MEDQVEEVKRKTDIVGTIGQYVSLKKMGRHHKGLCPFHAEKTASFTVNEEMGFYKCFGCNNGGDVIKFLMEIEGIDFRDALERLADKAGVKLITKKYEGGEQKQKLLEVMDLTARYYHWLLTEGKSGEKARKYLTDRGIGEKLIKTFNIGFALPGWDNLIKYLVKKKNYKVELLESAGLINKKTGGSGYFDKFRGRIMFPLLDAGGRVVGFSGRILPVLEKENEPKYLNSPETEIYHKGRMLFGFYQAKQAIREKKRAVLVEGQMDLISSFGAGVSESVAVGGTALTEDQVEMISRLAKTIYLSFDADEAGLLAIKRAVEMAEKRGLDVKVVQIEGGKDPDEIARKYPNKWKEMVEKAVDVYDFVMTKAMQRYDKNNVHGIKKITEEVVPFLSKIENSVVREVWIRKFADKLGVEVGIVKDEVERFKMGKKTQEKATTFNNAVEVVENKTEKLIRRLVGGLLVFPGVRDRIKTWFNKIDLPGASGKALKLVVEQEEADPGKIIENVQAELKEVLQEAYMIGGESENTTEKDVLDLAIQLIREAIREEKKKLMAEMEMARKEGLETEEDSLFAKLNDLNIEENKIVSLLG
ncbi:MAG: primase protein [Candidatus Collierbacteria bacterium GW2011_GWB1_45_35]|uniref:DNA primase n=1 Tax=Candidatus Collierbacteria bacterium GW2011_GWB2_45_17 TaxID=1618388 RepID=A0A837IEE0_9BACT|nr:MAG: primase protein [Microgenomates group bacterium GW2011_GWC1_44_23]KKT95661.1 MAG: primase protein [Candidatus Collierbacteria bacterium GW2011_GWA1_45_15]KKU00439.1 MAG: primase protein [Candidatus Collierbacteria bacterium GW2011_GWB2_45_17]KKU05540.1 MAG: primase protein [Candidatus Collierbacteria bacterium GW2011_GWB1_45_35]KKU08150.1 MAG: primase protein [Candidatus Collierbacteria bacterium GW2011_GWC2_45_40]HCX26017.1 DNA primase [Candidatus Collierbacteria bacterium]